MSVALDSECVKDTNDLDSTEPENKLDETKLRYENGKCFYTDPKTGALLEWSDENKAWIRAPEDITKDYKCVNGNYIYTDKSSGKTYKWDISKNAWEIQEEEDVEEFDEDEEIKKKEVVRQDMSKGIYSKEGDLHTYTDPSDGTVYEWDKEKNAWFPKLDEDFLAKYQMNYGFEEPKEENDEKPEVEKVEETSKVDALQESLKRKLEPPTWFEVDENTNNKVYVSNLPTDITEVQFVDLMQKCGLVMKDPDNGRMKVKLYTEKGSKELKGDALCTYIKVESVELALNLLDGYDFNGKKIKVERAKFTMKGDSYDPTLKPKKKRRKDKDKVKKMQEKLFDWRPEKMRGERGKHERIVIVKNLFEPNIFDDDVGLILEYQKEMRDECLKCGDVRKVTIYDRHPEGVAQINFKEAEAADACVQLLNGRWFGKRKITAETWDGKTKYKIAETEEEVNARINKWDAYLKQEEAAKKLEKEEREKNEPVKIKEDSDDDTRSSAGSGDETE